MKPSLLISLSLLLLCFARTQPLPAQAAAFDVDRLKTLLKSDRIMELRKASAMIAANPKEALVVIADVAKRANHPELTKAFQVLVSNAPDKTLQQLTSSPNTQQRDLLRSELNSRLTGPKPDSSAAKKRRYPTKSAPSSNTTSPIPPIMRPNPVPFAPKVTSPAPTTPSGATPSGATPSGATPSPVTSASTQQLFTRLATSRPDTISDEDLQLLFAILELDVAVGSRESSWVRRAHSELSRRYHVARAKIVARFLDPALKHPERLVQPALMDRTAERSVVDRAWQLIKSGTPAQKTETIRYFTPPQDRADEFAQQILAMLKQDKSLSDDFSYRLSYISRDASPQTRQEVVRFFLDQLNQAPPPRSVSLISLTSLSGPTLYASRTIEGMSEAEQLPWVTEIGRQLESTTKPFEYAKLLQSFKCSTSDVGPVVRQRMVGEQEITRKLAYAQCLYEVDGDFDQTYPLFKNVIQSRNGDAKVMAQAVVGIKSFGEKAAELVPDLIRLLENDQTYTRVYVASALGEMGAKASPALPVLARLSQTTPRTSLSISCENAAKKIKQAL